MCVHGHDSHRTHRSSSDKTPVSMSPTPLHSLFNEVFACICSSTWPANLLFHITLLFGELELRSGILRVSRCRLGVNRQNVGQGEAFGENTAHLIGLHLEN